jgi:TP901 family phage tail tape measure protein
MQRKLLEQAVEEKKITVEVERRATAEQQTIAALQQAVELRRAEFREALASRGGLQQRLAEGRPLGQAPGTGQIGPLSDDQSIGKILRQYRSFIGTDAGVENLRKRMEALGITNARVTSATEELSTGVRTFGFAIERGDGSVARATVRLDRFGSILKDTGNRFRNWSTAISNNLVKVVQWGLATGIVFGIMRGFRSVLREIIEIESELANVQIILGKGAGDLNTIFREAALVADLTSTSVKGVVEGYTLAYQAAGAFEDPTLRAAAANNLLQESMVLASLSGIDQATAMDTLVGALRQTGQELTEGRELLDRWVAVSRESNVSLNTLAQTYAIVGATATGLGLTFEELNALTATLAEATGLSATETGNAIRGIVAGFQSAQAEKVLDRFGIETRQATGELRDFWELLNEVSTLLASGAISAAELTEIANAIGGGYRRGAQVQTILEGMSRAQQLVNVQLNASGEASDALETKMATLQAAITRLGNAFTNLAQSLGDEGGFLWVANAIVDVMTFFVDTLDSLVGGLGKATPALLTFGAAWLALQSDPGQKLLGAPAGGLLTGAARAVAPRGSNLIQDRLGGQYGFPAGYTRGGALSGIRSGVQRGLGGIDPLSAGAAILPGLFTAIKGLGEEEETRPETFQKAGAQIAGGIAGALIAGPVGAIVGSAIGGAFADAVIDEERDIGARLAEIFIESTRTEGDRTTGAGAVAAFEHGDITAGEGLNQIAQELPQRLQTIADQFSFLVRAREFATPARGSIALQAPDETVQSTDVLLAAIFRKLGEDLPSDLAERIAGIDLGFIDAQIVPKLTEEDIEGASELIKALFEETVAEADIAGPLRLSIEAGTPDMEKAAGGVVGAFIDEAQRQFVLGDINVADMIGISELTAGTIAPELETLRQTLSLAGVDIGVNELVRSYLDLDTASKALLDTAADQVRAQSDLLSFYVAEGKSAEELADKTEDYNDALRNLAQLQAVISQRQLLADVDERPVVEFGALSGQQIERVRREADRVRDQYASAFADGNEEAAGLWVEALGDVLITEGEGIGKSFWGEFFNQDPEYIKTAIENLGLEDAISSATSFGLRDLRDQLGVSDFPSLLRRYEQVRSTITTQFPDYEVQEDPLGLILKDGFRTIHADQTLLNLAMQDLIDVNEQQLEGVWNLPSGMTAFVAWSSLFSRNIPSDTGAAAWPFQIADDVGGTTTATTATAGPTAYRSTAPIQQEVERLASLISQITERITAPGADRATIEEGEFHRESLSNRLTQLLDEQNKLIASRGQVAIDYQTGQPVSTTGQPDAEAIVQGFQEAFQLENKIELNASIRLVVDGRTLANVVKQYLFTDLVQATDRSLGGGGGYVIEAE